MYTMDRVTVVTCLANLTPLVSGAVDVVDVVDIVDAISTSQDLRSSVKFFLIMK